MKPKLVVLRGLPASGKSTYAAQLVVRESYKRFNRDDLRTMIDNNIYSKPNEAFITKVMYIMIEVALKNGYNVVVDNTNFAPYQIRSCREIARRTNADIDFRDFDVPLETCIARDLQRDNGRVGKEVITKMHAQWFKDNKFPDLPK